MNTPLKKHQLPSKLFIALQEANEAEDITDEQMNLLGRFYAVHKDAPLTIPQWIKQLNWNNKNGAMAFWFERLAKYGIFEKTVIQGAVFINLNDKL